MKGFRVGRVLVALVAVMLVAAACGGGKEQSGGACDGCTLIESGTLTIASDIPYPPFEFNKGGKLTGFDVELMDEIAGRLGLKPKWVNTDFNTIFTNLASGQFDTIAAAVTGYAPKGSPAFETVTERNGIIDFSKPYYPSLQSLTVNSGKRSDLTTYKDLKSGDRVGVQAATTGAFWAEVNLKPLGAELVSFAKAPDAYIALVAGNIDAVLNDLPVSEDAAKSHPELKVVEQIQTGEEYAFSAAKENGALLDAINRELQGMFDDGTYTTIYRKYFPTQDLPPYAKS